MRMRGLPHQPRICRRTHGVGRYQPWRRPHWRQSDIDRYWPGVRQLLSDNHGRLRHVGIDRRESRENRGAARAGYSARCDHGGSVTRNMGCRGYRSLGRKRMADRSGDFGSGCWFSRASRGFTEPLRIPGRKGSHGRRHRGRLYRSRKRGHYRTRTGRLAQLAIKDIAKGGRGRIGVDAEGGCLNRSRNARRGCPEAKCEGKSPSPHPERATHQPNQRPLGSYLNPLRHNRLTLNPQWLTNHQGRAAKQPIGSRFTRLRSSDRLPRRRRDQYR